MQINQEAQKAYEEVRERLKNRDTAFLGNASQKLTERAVPYFLKKGETMIYKGEKTDAAYYVITGKLYVQSDFLDGSVYQFSYLGKGAIIADVDILSGANVNAATLIAAEDVMALRLPLNLFIEEMKTNIDFLWYVSTGMARKFYVSSYERGMNLFKEGIDKVLLYLIREYELDEEERNTVKITKTRTIMANEIGISIKTLNRSIEKLETDGLVNLVKGKVTISEKQFEALLNRAEEKSLY